MVRRDGLGPCQAEAAVRSVGRAGHALLSQVSGVRPARNGFVQEEIENSFPARAQHRPLSLQRVFLRMELTALAGTGARRACRRSRRALRPPRPSPCASGPTPAHLVRDSRIPPPSGSRRSIKCASSCFPLTLEPALHASCSPPPPHLWHPTVARTPPPAARAPPPPGAAPDNPQKKGARQSKGWRQGPPTCQSRRRHTRGGRHHPGPIAAPPSTDRRVAQLLPFPPSLRLGKKKKKKTTLSAATRGHHPLPPPLPHAPQNTAASPSSCPSSPFSATSRKNCSSVSSPYGCATISSVA